MKFLFFVILSTGAFRICWQLNVYNEIFIIEIGIVSEFKESIERQKFCEESGKFRLDKFTLFLPHHKIRVDLKTLPIITLHSQY